MFPIYENMVVEWLLTDSEERNIERILWVSPSDDMVYCISVSDDKALPIIKTYSEYAAGFESNLCKQVEWINENIPLTDSSIDTDQLSIRDKAWDAIKDMVLHEPECFEKSLRGPMIKEIQEKQGYIKAPFTAIYEDIGKEGK